MCPAEERAQLCQLCLLCFMLFPDLAMSVWRLVNPSRSLSLPQDTARR